MNLIKKLFSIIIIIFAVAVIIFILKKGLKYIDRVEANGGTKIAAWSFNVTKSNTQKITVKLNENYDNTTLDEGYIAPGCEGEFSIVIDASNTSTGVEFKTIFENETKKPQNLKFIYDENTLSTLKELEPFLEGKILANEEEKKKIFIIKWIWKYETGENKEEILKNDKQDTIDAENLKEYSFNIIVEGKQLEPILTK